MRRNLRLMTTILTALFASMVLFGCGAPPKEALLNALAKNQDAKTYMVKGEMNLEVQENNKPGGILNNVRITWDGFN